MVLVGERKDSQTYVRSKKRACDEVGIVSFGTELAADVTEEEVLDVVRSYNANDDVHGILVQLPLPEHINEQKVLDAIDICKDVDGFHPLNIGCLAMRGRHPRFVSCTPKGCMELLKRNDIQLSVRAIPFSFWFCDMNWPTVERLSTGETDPGGCSSGFLTQQCAFASTWSIHQKLMVP